MHLQILWSFALRLQNFVISFWKWINSSWMTHNRSLPFLKTGYFDFIVMFIFININNLFIIWEKCVCFYILCITKTQTSHVRKLRFEAKINCIKSRATKHMTSGENKKKKDIKTTTTFFILIVFTILQMMGWNQNEKTWFSWMSSKAL